MAAQIPSIPQDNHSAIERDRLEMPISKLQRELVETILALKQKELFIEHLLAATTNPIYIYQLTEGRYSFLNHELAYQLDYNESTAERMLPKMLETLVHPEDASALKTHYESCAKAVDGDVLQAEYRLKHAFGEWHWFSSRDTVYSRFPDGRVREILGVLDDISERRRNLEKIWQISTHDELTGLYNRIYYEEEVTRLERGRRFPITIVIADVDGLQRVNDTQGNATGDMLLRSAGEILKVCFRSDDMVARIGGDEFCALLPDFGMLSAEAILERVLHRLEIFNQAHPTSPLTLSIGIATASRGDVLRTAVKEAGLRMEVRKEIAKGKGMVKS